MISEKLAEDLLPHLIDAKNVWIAVALMKEEMYNKIQDAIPQNSIQNFLIGVDLPTHPIIFEKMIARKSIIFKARVYQKEVFHPKVYLIEKENGFIAFIGSANATTGGFNNNIELNFKIENFERCIEIKKWFENLYLNGDEIDDDFLKDYSTFYNSNGLSKPKKVFKRKIAESKNKFIENDENIDDEQFFTNENFSAFSQLYHTDDSDVAKRNRKSVRLKLLELNDMIFPSFLKHGLKDIHLPKSKREYTSQYFHSSRNSKIKDAIWLNYGKSQKQLKDSEDKSFSNNIRMQIILRNNINSKSIGIWVFVGKNKTSIEDRTFIKSSIEKPYYLELLLNYLVDLGVGYSISINSRILEINNLLNENSLKSFLLQDDYKGSYFIMKNYSPIDNKLSKTNIQETVLKDFSKLYKIYNLFRKK